MDLSLPDARRGQCYHIHFLEHTVTTLAKGATPQEGLQAERSLWSWFRAKPRPAPFFGASKSHIRPENKDMVIKATSSQSGTKWAALLFYK